MTSDEEQAMKGLEIAKEIVIFCDGNPLKAIAMAAAAMSYIIAALNQVSPMDDVEDRAIRLTRGSLKIADKYSDVTLPLAALFKP